MVQKFPTREMHATDFVRHAHDRRRCVVGDPSSMTCRQQMWARRLLWLALFLPFMLTIQRTTSEVQGGPGLVDIFRSGGAAAACGIAVLCSRSSRWGMGVV